MSTVIVFTPCSRETQWLMSLRIKPGVSRVGVTLHKITRLFHQTRLGNPADVLLLFSWYTMMRQMEHAFDREIIRLTKIVKRKCRDALLFTPHSGERYRMKITTPAAACFYRVLTKHDTVMCLVETCVVFAIFKKRDVRSKKSRRYSRGILQCIAHIGAHRFSAHDKSPAPLSEKEKATFAVAIHSEVMPIFRSGLWKAFTALTA